MIKIDVNRISESYLGSLRDSIIEEIHTCKCQVISNYTLEDLQEMSFKEMESLFVEYGLDNVSEKVNVIKRNKTERDKNYFFTATGRRVKEERIDSILAQLNSRVSEKRKKVQNQIYVLESHLKLVDALMQVLYSGEFCDDKEVDNLKDTIAHSQLDDMDKINLSFRVSKIINDNNRLLSTDKVRAEVVSFDKKIEDFHHEKNAICDVKEESSSYGVVSGNQEDVFLSFIDKCWEKYLDLFLFYGIEKNDDYMSREEVDKFVFMNSFQEMDFAMIMSSLITKFSSTYDVKDKRDSQIYYDYIVQFDACYDNYKKNKDALLKELYYVFRYLSPKNYSCLVENQSEIENYYLELSNLHSEVFMLIDEVQNNILTGSRMNEIHLEVEKVCKKIEIFDKNYSIKFEEEKELVFIKSFVLFDYYFDEDGMMRPYILQDLDIKSRDCLIDRGLESGKLLNSCRDFSKLVKDLMLTGYPAVVDPANSSVSNRNDRIVSSVYYDVRDKKSLTGMSRIHPSIGSALRFIEQKVVLKHDSKIFEQVISIIQKELPFAKVSPDEDFAIYINFATALKRSDRDSYGVAIKRYNHCPVFLDKVFLNGLSDNRELSDDECVMLHEVVKMSLQAFYDLSKNNPNFDFEFIEKMGRGSNYSL